MSRARPHSGSGSGGGVEGVRILAMKESKEGQNLGKEDSMKLFG